MLHHMFNPGDWILIKGLRIDIMSEMKLVILVTAAFST